MFTHPWNAVDRRIGLGIALCGLAIVLLNSIAFASRAEDFAAWWIALALVVPVMQLVSVVGWARLPRAGLRGIWMAQPVVLFVVLVLTFLAWDGREVPPPSPQVWLLDSMVVAALALVLRLPYVLAATLLLAAAVPLSALAFLGEVPAVVLSWGFVHASNVIYVMLALVLRRQMDRLWRARALAERLRDEDERIRSEAADFDGFARTVHDEVLSTFAAALQLEGESPPLLRRSAATALTALRVGDREAPGPVELAAGDAGQLIVDLVAAAAPRVAMSATTSPGEVSSAAAGAVGLAAAEAARNAARHAGGGSGTVVVADGSIRVTIVDSGPGFDPARIVSGRLGIRESIVRRVEDLDRGRVAFDSGPSGTTVVMAWSRPPE